MTNMDNHNEQEIKALAEETAEVLPTNAEEEDQKREKRLWRIFIALSLVLSLLLGVLAGVCICRFTMKNHNPSPTYVFPTVDGDSELPGEDLKLFYEVYNIIATNYAGEMSPEDMMKEAMTAYVAGLNDPYSAYMTNEQANSFIDGNYGKKKGIGVRIYRLKDSVGMYVYQVMGNSPAEEAGVLRGDVVVAVDGVELTEENYDTLVSAVSGEDGTVVTLTVKRGDEVLDIDIIRGDFVASSVEYRVLETAPHIGYVQILSLASDTAKEFKAAIESLEDMGAESYIFDVRDDSGGYLGTITDVLDMLLPEGPIIRYTDSSGKETIDYSDESVIMEAPMAVLINGGTASAAELFAAALKDYELAVLVGETTYGKGVMQTLFELSNGDTLKLTTSMYHPPFSDNYNGIGVLPDVEVKYEGDKPIYILSEEEDTQLQAAINALEKKAQQD